MNDSHDTLVQGDDDREVSRRLSLQGNQPLAEVDGYTMVRQLGTGTYGTVWLAREDHTGRMVAIKYYPHRRGVNWSLLSREVEKLATLYTSRNIVRLLDVGWNADPPYYIMEFVENGSLGGLLATGPLTVSEAVRITREVCRALIEAHGAGVLHCDLKPDNVLLDSQFQVRLCDFGQSRMSHERTPALGTLYYMAPEQADLDAVADSRWDVYAVGALLYHMLTGQPSHRSPEIQQRLEAADTLESRLKVYRTAIRDAPASTGYHAVRGIDRRLIQIINSCLAVDPARRLPNAQAILAELDGRDRHRARGPLLVLGVLGPLLLMAAMVPIFVSTLQSNLAVMERRLTNDALGRDALAAGIQANALQEELEDRLDELDQIISKRDYRPTLEVLATTPPVELARQTRERHDQPSDARPKWVKLLDAAHAQVSDRNTQRNHSPDTSWFLQDATGIQVWRRPFSPDTVGQDYSWRDYFHGEDKQYPRGDVPDEVRAIESPHVSLPFRSEATDRYMVALSIPVRSRNGDVIGVFARTIHLGDLQRDQAHRIQGDHNDSVTRMIALADRRTGQLLDHPWLTSDAIQDSADSPDSLFRQLRIERPDSQIPQLGPPNSPVFVLESYRDPVGDLNEKSAAEYRGDWMAAMVPIQSDRTPWLVIVQEKRDAALQPVADMTREARRTAWIAVGTSLTLMGIVWAFVWRALDRSGTSHLIGTGGSHRVQNTVRQAQPAS